MKILVILLLCLTPILALPMQSNPDRQLLEHFIKSFPKLAMTIRTTFHKLVPNRIEKEKPPVVEIYLPQKPAFSPFG